MNKQIVGMSVFAAGIVLLITNLDLFGLKSVVAQYWPAFGIFIGVMMMISSRMQWGAIVTLISSVLLFRNLTDASINLWLIIWPAVIMLIGISLLMPRKSSEKEAHDDAVAQDEITAILGGTSRALPPKKLQKLSVVAILGGVELDMSKADIVDGAVLDATAVLGGIDLRVPEHVMIENRTTAILGGVEDKTRATEAKHAPTLIVTGTVAFGGIEIKR